MERILAPQWIWIAWEQHRRSRELAADLGMLLFEHDVRLPRLLRHPYLLARTLYLIARHRPDGIVVQSPSIVLALWACLLRPLFGYVLVVDAHNEGIRPYSERLAWLLPLYGWIQRRADLTIVTNARLAAVVESNGGRPFVLEDKLPSLRSGGSQPLRQGPTVVCISTFAKDEPYADVLEAARTLGDGITVYMTGDWRKLDAQTVAGAPSNVVFTGFLPDEEYTALLAGASLVLDLTHLDDCLVCGAYEAVALGKPVVLTDTPASRDYFYKGALYTRNEAPAIARTVRAAVAAIDVLAKDVAALRAELSASWQRRRAALVAALNALTGLTASTDTPARGF